MILSRWVFCLVVWSLSSHSRIFHSYGDVTIAGEGLQILTYARHSWPLSSEGSLMCHTHCDTGLPFIMVISEDPWHLHLLPSIWQWSCHYLFLRLRSRPRIEPWSPACEANKQISTFIDNLIKHHRPFGVIGENFFEKI